MFLLLADNEMTARRIRHRTERENRRCTFHGTLRTFHRFLMHFSLEALPEALILEVWTLEDFPMTQDMNQSIDQNTDRDSEQRDQHESRKGPAAKKSLVAFLRSIKFNKPRKTVARVEQEFAQLHPRTRAVEKDSRWVPSAN